MKNPMVVVGALAFVSCGGDAVATTSTPVASLAACIPTRSVQGGPISDPGGPYFHQTVLANTTDGLALTNAHQVLDHASVPDGVRLADGGVMVYYVNGEGGAIWAARIEADTARVVGSITINGVTKPAGVVDPDATLLSDGTVRLAYFGGFGPPGTSTPRAMCIADSNDGMQFTVKSVALAFNPPELLTDPSLLALGDGTWLMAISAGQRTIIARSSDGLTFTREATLDIGGVPELARTPDGQARLYVCRQGIVAYRSSDGGRAWSLETTVVGPGFGGKPIVCDPSYVAGAGLFVFKTG